LYDVVTIHLISSLENEWDEAHIVPTEQFEQLRYLTS